jgi:hypothetical protein
MAKEALRFSFAIPAIAGNADEEPGWSLGSSSSCRKQTCRFSKRFKDTSDAAKSISSLTKDRTKDHPPVAPSKLRDFELFSTIVEKITNNVHMTSNGLEEIWNLKRRMHKGSLDAGNPPVQWERQ